MRWWTPLTPFWTCTWNVDGMASVSSTPIGGSARLPSRRSSMPLVKGGHLLTDPFVSIPDGEALPSEGAIIVSLARWQEERGLIATRKDPLGVRLKAADPV